jgi:hypothetical protein
MRDLGTLLSELEQHEPSFDLVTEARRRAAQRPSQAPGRWHGKAKRGVGLAATAVVTVGVLVILALAAHSRSSTRHANSPTHPPKSAPNTPRQKLVADAELISASLASEVTSAQSSHPPIPSEVVADPAWGTHARADRHRLTQNDPLYTIFDQIVTAQRLAGVGRLDAAQRLVLPAANQARQYALGHPSQSPLQPPAWAVRFFALNERSAIKSIERFVRKRRGGYHDLVWTAYGFTDVQTPTQPGTPTYTHPLSWLRPGTLWYSINQLHLQIPTLLLGPNRKALAVLKRLDEQIGHATANSQ